MMNINSWLIYVPATIVTDIGLIYAKVTPTLWGALIHERVVEQMAGAGLVEKLVLGLTDMVGFVSIMGGIGFAAVITFAAFVRGLTRG